MTKARDIASAAPAPSTVSTTEIGYLDGVTSAIQTQLNAKLTSAGGSLTDNGIVRLDGTSGASIQGSGVTIDDNNGLLLTGNISQNAVALTSSSNTFTADVTNGNYFTGVNGGLPSVVGTAKVDFGASTSGTFTFSTGIPLAPNDLVLVAVTSDAGSAMSVTSSGWTSSTVSATTAYGLLAYKYMGSTVDTSISVSGMATASTGVAIVIRGVSGTPVIQSATGATLDPDSPSVTTTVNNSIVVAIGGQDDDTVTTITAPTGYSYLTWQTSSATGQTTMLAAKIVTTAGAENPSVWVTDGDDEWVAWSVAFAPLYSGVTQTLTVSNIPARPTTVVVESKATNLTFSNNIFWENGITPTLRGNDLLILTSSDGGTTLYGQIRCFG